MEPIIMFLNANGKQIGSTEKLLPIPFYKGMQLTITGSATIFEVVDWNYHHGHPEEKSGLRVILKPIE